jgi:flagellar basal-body rod protein FlgC
VHTALDISASALVAQRARLDAIAGNIANMSSLKDESGKVKPYEGRYVVFQTDENVATRDGAVGVKVAAVKQETVPPLYKYQPQHPLADENGYVAYPNIDLNSEFVDALEATRAYEANVGVIEISKNMAAQTLRIVG